MKVLVIRENERIKRLDDNEFIKFFYQKKNNRINSNISRYHITKVLSYDNEKRIFDRCFNLEGIDIDGDHYHYRISKVKDDDKIKECLGMQCELKSCIPIQIKQIDMKEG